VVFKPPSTRPRTPRTDNGTRDHAPLAVGSWLASDSERARPAHLLTRMKVPNVEAPYFRQQCQGNYRRHTGRPNLNDKSDELCRGQNGQSLAQVFYGSIGHNARDKRGAFHSFRC
jgi:hypothetical protein